MQKIEVREISNVVLLNGLVGQGLCSCRCFGHILHHTAGASPRPTKMSIFLNRYEKYSCWKWNL